MIPEYTHIKWYCPRCGKIHINNIGGTTNPNANNVYDMCPWCYATNSINATKILRHGAKIRHSNRHKNWDDKQYNVVLAAMITYSDKKKVIA